MKPPVMADTPAVGTGAAELTPELLISDEPSGMPGRGTPPTVVGEVDDGADDAMTFVDPEPHMPDMPDVSIVPDGVESPDAGGIAGDIPGVVAEPPAIAPVAGAVDPAAIPPPSKLAADPNMSVGAVATVEQTIPLSGIAIVPVAGAASGLTPADESSVAPSGMPVGEIGAPGLEPRGDVAEIVGVGIAMPVICASATCPDESARRIATVWESFIYVLHDKTIDSSSRRAATARGG